MGDGKPMPDQKSKKDRVVDIIVDAWAKHLASYGASAYGIRGHFSYFIDEKVMAELEEIFKEVA